MGGAVENGHVLAMPQRVGVCSRSRVFAALNAGSKNQNNVKKRLIAETAHQPHDLPKLLRSRPGLDAVHRLLSARSAKRSRACGTTISGHILPHCAINDYSRRGWGGRNIALTLPK
jgi:hypothetical protein